MQSSWCCTWRLRSSCQQHYTAPKRTSTKANFCRLTQSNRVNVCKTSQMKERLADSWWEVNGCVLCFLSAVIRKLNQLYKTCVTQCHSLNRRLQTFLLDKQKLIDRFSGLTAEKLLYSHTVHMVSAHPAILLPCSALALIPDGHPWCV